MSTLARWVLSHKTAVVACWVVVTLAGVAAVGPASNALKSDSSVPNKEGWATNAAIAEHYGADSSGTSPLLPVVTLPRGETVRSPGVRADLKRLDARLQRALPGARIASYASTGDKTFVSRDARTIFALVYPRPDPSSDFGENPIAAKAARHALRRAEVGGRPVRLTGFDALAADGGSNSGGPGLLLEAVVGAAGALLVLTFVFASLLAFIPIVMALVSIMTTFLLLLGLTRLTSVSPIVEFLIALIGLGVAIDYSLLMVSRWREERAHGHSGDDAVQRAMETAGRAVVFSGLTVAIGLLALIALPVPFLSSMGYGGVLIPLVSTLVAITLLPVVLAKLGPRLDWPHVRTDDKASRTWTRWATAVSRRRWIAATGGMAVLLTLAFAATGLRMGSDDADTMAKSGDARLGLVALERAGIGEGALLPHEILVEGATSPERAAAVLQKIAGVYGAIAPDSPEWRRDGTSLLEAVPVPDSGSHAGLATLQRVREAAHSAGPDVRVGGQPAENQDFIDAVYGSFPLIIALITMTTFVLLARAFRSLLLPLKAILLNILSVAAAWGVMVLVWQHGYGSGAIWGIHATGSIASWMPLMVFAFLFGLSMDYEVFILSRMREEYDRCGSTETAVIRGIGRTGRLVTCAALILFLAFTSMASAPDTDTKIAATGLAAGILLDATLIRALIVPAVITLMGRWNWWLPSWPARLLRVEPSLPGRAVANEAR
jgi:RND superfamily putative drug exporter